MQHINKHIKKTNLEAANVNCTSRQTLSTPLMFDKKHTIISLVKICLSPLWTLLDTRSQCTYLQHSPSFTQQTAGFPLFIIMYFCRDGMCIIMYLAALSFPSSIYIKGNVLFSTISLFMMFSGCWVLLLWLVNIYSRWQILCNKEVQHSLQTLACSEMKVMNL